MNTRAVVLQGVITSDGVLELEESPRLPAGRVEVTIRPLAAAPSEDVMVVLGHIWAEQKARGHVPRTREEIDAELNALREEAEAELQEREQITRRGRRTPE